MRALARTGTKIESKKITKNQPIASVAVSLMIFHEMTWPIWRWPGSRHRSTRTLLNVIKIVIHALFSGSFKYGIGSPPLL